MTSPGSVLLDQLQQELPVEDDWATAGSDARTWWFSTLPTIVWAEPQPHLDGGPWVRLHARTVVATHVLPIGLVYRSLAEENMSAIMSALVLDAANGELSLNCQATFDTERPAGGRLDLFRAAVLYQTAVAEHYGTLWPLPGGERPTTPHPTSGVRAEASMLTSVILQVTRTNGDEMATITQAELEAIEAELQDYVLWSIQGHGRLSFEVGAGSDTPRVWAALTNDSNAPWEPEAAPMAREVVSRVAEESGEDPAVNHQVLWGHLEGPKAARTGAMRISTEDDHPILGRGLMTLLLLPGKFPADQAPQLANALNLWESATPIPLSQFGAWSARDLGDGWQLAYSGFVPSMFTKDMDSGGRTSMVSDLAGEIAMRAQLAMQFIDGARAESDA